MLTENNHIRICYFIQTILTENGFDINPVKLNIESYPFYIKGLIKDFENPFNCVDQIVYHILKGENIPEDINLIIEDIKFNCKFDYLNYIFVEKSSFEDLDNLLDNDFSNKTDEFKLDLI